MNGGGDAARRYQTTSAHLAGHEWAGSKDHPEFRPMDRENRPEPFKEYVGLPVVPLPRNLRRSGQSAIAVLSGAGEAPAPLVNDQLLAGLLFHAAGVTRVGEKDGRRTCFRAAPAAGNLHPVELYVVSGGVGGVADGVHHFAPAHFGLVPLRSRDHRAELATAVGAAGVATAPVSVVLTAIPWRTAWKYSERGLRHVYWDAGTIVANLTAVCAAAGLAYRVHLGFVDALVGQLVGVDGRREFPVAVVTIGAGSDAEPPAGPAPASPRLAAATQPPAGRVWDFPSIQAAHLAGTLDSVEDVLGWREAAALAGHHAGAPVPPLEATAEPIESVILRRGSTRLMRRSSLPADVLDWVLAVATMPCDVDFAPVGGTLLGIEVSLHSVEGHGTGRFHWVDGTIVEHVRESEAAARAEARRLCLGQPLGGDSAFTAFLCADLELVVKALGDRGYRAVQIEAGIVAGRLQLAAFSVGLGGTGLTFYDDAVPLAFGASSSCALVTAIGTPGYTSTAGGPPGQPAELTHQAELMERLMARMRENEGAS